MRRSGLSLLSALALVAAPTLPFTPLAAQDSTRSAAPTRPPRPIDPKLAKLKAEALTMVEARSKQVQEIVDMLFSFQELGFQEFESQKYLTGIFYMAPAKSATPASVARTGEGMRGRSCSPRRASSQT